MSTFAPLGISGALLHLAPLLFAVVVVVAYAFVCERAPLGWEDQDGFHRGEPPEEYGDYLPGRRLP